MAAVCDYGAEYAKLRLHNPFLIGWVSGALTLLVAGYATDSGRELVSKRPPSPTVNYGMVSFLNIIESTRRILSFPKSRSVTNFISLLRIAIPSWRSKETGIIFILSIFMILRTVVSVNLAKMMGRLGRTVIECNKRSLFRDILLFFLACIPAALLNTSLDYYREVLELCFRQNLTTHFHRRYITRKVFFRLAGLHEINHVDHYLTNDIQSWSAVSARLFTFITRPLCEVVTFSYFLGRQTGYAGPSLVWGYYIGFLYLLLNHAPNQDELIEQRMEKEARFRSSIQEVLSYAEEICLSNGVQYRKKIHSLLAADIADHDRYECYLQTRFVMLERLYTLYGSRVVGYLVSFLSLLRTGPKASVADLTAIYSETSYTYHILAKSVYRLIGNVKLFLVVSGYTQRLSYLMESLEEVERKADLMQNLTYCSPVAKNAPMLGDQDNSKPSFPTAHGRIVRGDHIEFIDVPLTLPNGEILCSSLSFFVKPGMNVLVMGPNGCGKSSTFRLLGELWPLYGGRIIKPAQEHLSYMPQRPYIHDGTLFEQLIYPIKRKNADVSEADLYKYLQLAGLDYIFENPEISWDTKLSKSSTVLSMSEKQRLAMACLFFHGPRFAILDECSSLVDLDVERLFYTTCRNMGISVITIAHRRTVWQYHKWILYFDGCGGYFFSPVCFEDQGSTLLLTNVISGSDPSKLGKEMRIKVSNYWEDELISDKIAMQG
ncbi:unnamed protein product [Phytomonas sp. EM1]|nr:unnamed protein product [Phytomonas sp. EM1]|eukprot:CCW65410.1 unnamed protein product [Phytomonas sp. isolate EM1]